MRRPTYAARARQSQLSGSPGVVDGEAEWVEVTCAPEFADNVARQSRGERPGDRVTRQENAWSGAETEGFEPSVPLRGLHLSRVVH